MPGTWPCQGGLSAQLRFLEERPGCALVGGQVRFVDAEGRETHKEAFPTEDGAIRRAMRGRNVFIHPAVMIRTQVLREVGLYREGYPAGRTMSSSSASCAATGWLT
jgi:hypothetical protein